MNLDIVIFGLAITSSWGNGHAVTYRSLARALAERGHSVTFFEREMPWYSEHRDIDAVPYCGVELYDTLRELPLRAGRSVSEADLVIVGSYVPDGAILAEWVTGRARGVTAFYDIDTPVTLAGLAAGTLDYISPALIPRFDLYLSFTGGPTLELIEQRFGSPRARVLYCSADLDLNGATGRNPDLTLGYLGTYSADRQPALERLLLAPARHLAGDKFAVAGAQYPEAIQWPPNVARIAHVSPSEHPAFYSRQRFTLNVTRREMISAGHSPSVRLFEAAACGTPVISDRWPGLAALFRPGEEIMIADTTQQVIEILDQCPEERRRGIAAAARKRLMRQHTPAHRAVQLEEYYRETLAERPGRVRGEVVA